MSARWGKIRSDLTSNRVRSLLAVVSLAVGTAAVGAMHFAGTQIGPSFERSFLGSNPPSALLGTSGFDADLVLDVAAHPDVAAAEGRRRLVTRAVTGSGDRVTVELVAMTDFGANRVARIEPESGAWPPEGEGVVVERASLDELAVGRGDAITIELAERPSVDLDVVGTAFDVYEVAPDLGGPARLYVSMETMVDLTDSTQLDTLYLRATGDALDRDRALAMTAAVRDDVLAPSGVAIELSAIREPGEHRAASGVLFMVPTMQILSLLALAVAVALIVNTIAALLAQQRRQMGMMKAVGATSGQLQAQYLAAVALLSSAALVLALPVSLLGGYQLARFTAGLANFELQPLTVPWTTIAIEATIVMLVPMAAVIVQVRRACSRTVQDAVTDRGITATGGRRLPSLRLSRPTVLALRNAARNPVRLGLTVVTIAACGAVLVGVLSTGRSLGVLTDEVAGYWAYDVELALNRSVPLARAEAAIVGDPAVERVEGWISTQGFRLRPDGTENENISITSVPTGSSSIRPTLLQGRWFGESDRYPIVINSHLADEEPDLALGDEMMLDVEGRRRAWTVVGVATTTLVGPVAYLPAEVLAGELGRPGETNFLAVELSPGADQAEVAERLESTARRAGLPLGSVLTSAEHRAFVDDLFFLVVTFLLIVGAVLAAVAMIGVAGALTLSVVDQTREIGVVRTLGASGRAVRHLFLVQGLGIAAVGCVVGIAASLPVAWALRTAIGRSLIAAPLPAGFSWSGVGLWVVIALAIGALGATRPARTAARLTVRETLAYE